MDPSDHSSKALETAELERERVCLSFLGKREKWLLLGATSGGALAAATPPERLPQGLGLAGVIRALLSQRLVLPGIRAGETPARD